MRKSKANKAENSERWLLTYSDLITLLMILFVLLFAMSNVSAEKYKDLSQSLGSAFGAGQMSGSESVLPGENGVLDGGNLPTNVADGSNDGTAEATGSITTQSGMQKFEDQVQTVLNENNMGNYVNNTVTDDGLLISFSDKVFFDTGDATLKPDMKQGLKELAVLLNRIKNELVIEGHTDNIPINRGVITSNWQLSSLRASNVVEFLAEECKVDGARLSAVGYGDFRPVASNDTTEGRSKNRRINIVVLYDRTNLK